MKRRTWDSKKNCRAALLSLFALAARQFFFESPSTCFRSNFAG